MRPAVTVGTALGTFKGVVPKPNRIGTAATGSLISFITGHDYILNSLNAPAFPPTSFKDCFCACFAFWKLLCSPTVKCKGDQGFLYKLTKENKLKLISMKIKLILSGQTELSPPSRGYSKKKSEFLIHDLGLQTWSVSGTFLLHLEIQSCVSTARAVFTNKQSPTFRGFC